MYLNPHALEHVELQNRHDRTRYTGAKIYLGINPPYQRIILVRLAVIATLNPYIWLP